METRVNIRKLIDDLQSFKNCVRAMQNSADQQEALTALDLITADDRSLQQAISVEIANQTMLNDLINATKRIEDLQEERLNFANTIAAKLFELEEDIRNDHQRLSRFKARLGNADKLEMNSVLSAASSIAYTQGPPLGWTPQAPLRRHRPPYPSEDLMRASLLFRKMNLHEKSEQETSATPQVTRTSHDSVVRQQVEAIAQGFDIMDLDLNPDLL